MDANDLQVGNWIKYRAQGATDGTTDTYYRILEKNETTVNLKSADEEIIRDLEY